MLIPVSRVVSTMTPIIKITMNLMNFRDKLFTSVFLISHYFILLFFIGQVSFLESNREGAERDEYV